jgi:hypothetical protein
MSLVQRQNIFDPAQEAPNSTANRTLFQAQESELVGGQEARVRLPHSNNTFIDTSQSFLQFDLSATLVGTGLATPAAAGSLPRVNMCDLGAESAIQSISVFCGGRLVNQFNNYYKICALLRNSNVSVYNSQGVSLATNSTSNDYRCTHLGNPIKPDTAGGDTETSLTFKTKTVGFPLLGLLGSPNKMLPMGLLSSDIDIQIRFSDTETVFWTPFGGATAPTTINHSASTLNISNVSFNAKVVTVSDATNAEISRMSRDDEGIMSWSGSCWSLDSETTLTKEELAAGTKINKVLSGFRYKSLKTIATTAFVPRGSITKTNIPETACLGYFGKTDGIQYSLAGINYPQTPATNIAQACAVTNATFANVSVATSNNLLDGYTCEFNQRPDALGSVTDCPATVCAINLEDSMVSGNAGIDTVAIQVVAKVGIDAVVSTSTAGLQAAFFANYDVLYSVNPDGILSCSF